ncbi:MAG TPA: hypothetical protein VHC22_31680 [Pirellulales bacterium]|nr:hypothetical protein [Pirellulales bacterium]
MNRWFQFSLGRLCGSVSLWCLAGVLWRQLHLASDSSPVFNPFAFAGFVIAMAVGVGLLFQRAVPFAFAAYVCLVIVPFVALLGGVLYVLW